MGKVSVRFFARYAEIAGMTWREMRLDTPTTIAEVIAHVRKVFPDTQAIPARPLVALNLRQAKLDAVVNEGDEVALLPPFAGG